MKLWFNPLARAQVFRLSGFFSGILISVLIAAPPRWTSIAAESWQSYRFWNDGKSHAIEGTPAKLPAAYQFLRGPVPQRTTCPLENRPGVFWFTPGGKSLDRTFVTPAPSDFHISPLQRSIKGFAAAASFAGSATGNGSAVEVVYFTDRVCSDAGVEYGFSRDLATSSILVYWSTYANCGNDAASLCRKTNDPGLGKNFSNVQQENGGIASDHGFRIYGLDLNARYTYRMSIEQGAFRVEVVNGSIPALCSDSESGPRRPCTFLKRVQPWFPIDQIENGYIVSGTQTLGEPVVAKGSAFDVSDILVAR